MMKLHSIVIPTMLSTLLLTASAAHSMETPPADLICAEAKLTSIMTSGTLEQFKSALEQEVAHVEPTSFWAHTHLRRSLSEHAKTLRQQKLTQLTTTLSKSRIRAGVKAGIFGLIAAARIYSATEWQDDEHRNYLLNRVLWEGLLKNIILKGSYIGFHDRTLIWDILILCISSTWVYENAHFTYYGNKPLIAEIKKLDDIILYLTNIPDLRYKR